LAAAAIITLYLIISPNLINTTKLETDLTYRKEKRGKGPEEKKGRTTEVSKDIEWIRELVSR